MKVLIVSPKNEISGSCVSIANLKRALDHTHDVEIISTHGDFFNGENITEIKTKFDLWKELINYSKRKEHDIVVFNTILSLPLMLLCKRPSILYVHENNLRLPSLFHLLRLLTNLFNISVACVNPLQLKKFDCAYLVPNCLELDSLDTPTEKKNQCLMISNLQTRKGIFHFLELARSCRKYEFILLTNGAFMSPRNMTPYFKEQALVYKRLLSCHIPPNFKIVFDQSMKRELLAQSKYLLSLSEMEETFGIVLLEAICRGTIPMALPNDGSQYCINNKVLLLNKDQLVESFEIADQEITPSYDRILEELRQHCHANFSFESVRHAFQKASQAVSARI